MSHFEIPYRPLTVFYGGDIYPDTGGYYQMENVTDELNMIFTSLIKPTMRKPQIINKKNILEGILKDPKKISSLPPLADEKKIRIAYKAIQVDDSSTESLGEILKPSSSKSNSTTILSLVEKNYILSFLQLIDKKAILALRPQILKIFDEIIKSKRTASENNLDENAMSHIKIFFKTFYPLAYRRYVQKMCLEKLSGLRFSPDTINKFPS